VQFWMSQYQDKIGREYKDFSKKDGVAIAAVVKAVGLGQFKTMAVWLLTTSEKWYCDNRTPTILRSKINDIPALMNKPAQYGRQPGFETAAKEDTHYAQQRAENQREIDRIMAEESSE
jgi:hypothetical protein